MTDQEKEARRWTLDEAPRLVQVTALNPLSGKAQKLGPGELRGVLELLWDYEANPEAPGILGQFEELGLDAKWFSEPSRKSRPLFIMTGPDEEVVGYSLHELLEAVREVGRKAAGLEIDAKKPLGRPRDKMVYIVDDDDSIRDLLAYALSREGFQTDVFVDGSEVLQKIRNTLPAHPDLILLDLMMPKRGGYDVIRELQERDFPPVPIIVVTGRHIDRAAVEELRAEKNVVDFLAKPLNPSALVLSAHQLLKTAPAARGA